MSIPSNIGFRPTQARTDKQEFLGPFQLKQGIQKSFDKSIINYFLNVLSVTKIISKELHLHWNLIFHKYITFIFFSKLSLSVLASYCLIAQNCLSKTFIEKNISIIEAEDLFLILSDQLYQHKIDMKTKKKLILLNVRKSLDIKRSKSMWIIQSGKTFRNLQCKDFCQRFRCLSKQTEWNLSEMAMCFQKNLTQSKFGLFNPKKSH